MAGKRGNGEGSAPRKRKDGRWEARVIDVAGKRQSVYGSTRDEVAKQQTLLLKARQDGRTVVNNKTTLAQYLSMWLETVKPNLRPRTFTRSQQTASHAVAALGNTPLAKLTPVDLQRLYASRLAAGAAPRTVIKLHSLLHDALDQAARWDMVVRNVADLVDAPRAQRHEMQTLTPEDVRRLLSAAETDRFHALYALAVTSGMRQGELLALHWHDIDLESGTAVVCGSLSPTTDGPKILPPKNNRTRRVDLSASARRALQRHRVAQNTERLEIGPAWEDNNLVFPNTLGRPMSARNLLARSYVPLLARAGVPKIRFHDLRHTAATLMLAQGVHYKIASEMLGHSQSSITMDLYSHVSPTMQREAAVLIDAAIWGT